jgi:hypothetical protein
VSLPPKWVDVVDRCEEHFEGLDKNCEALAALHTKRLMVRRPTRLLTTGKRAASWQQQYLQQLAASTGKHTGSVKPHPTASNWAGRSGLGTAPQRHSNIITPGALSRFLNW